MKRNITTYFFLFIITNQMSTDFLFHPQRSLGSGSDEEEGVVVDKGGEGEREEHDFLPNSHKVTFYHQIRLQILASLRGYLYADPEKYAIPDHSVDDINNQNLINFFNNHFTEETTVFFKNDGNEEEKKISSFKIHEIGTEGETEKNRLKDHEKIILKLFANKEKNRKIIDIVIDPNLRPEDLEKLVDEDNEKKKKLEELKKNDSSQEKENPKEKKESFGKKMVKEQLIITLDNQVVQSTMKLFYANHINDAIREFINLNIWKFMEKTRQIIGNLEPISKDITNVLEIIFNFDKGIIKYKNKNLDTIIKNENKENENKEKVDFFKYKKFDELEEKKNLIKYQIEIIKEINEEQQDVKNILKEKQVKLSKDTKCHKWILTPNFDSEGIELFLMKVEKVEKVEKEGEVPEKKPAEKILFLVRSSYFSFQYEFNILTKNFIIKNIERIMKKIKNETLFYLQMLEHSSPNSYLKELNRNGINIGKGKYLQQYNDKEELDKVKDKKQDNLGKLNEVIKNLANLELVGEETKKNNEEFNINLKYDVNQEDKDGNNQKLNIEYDKTYPMDSQYNSELFYHSYLQFLKDVNYYILPVAIKKDGEDEYEVKENIYNKEMANPFIGNETITQLGHNLQKIVSKEVSDKLLQSINLGVSIDDVEKNYNFDYVMKNAEDDTNIFLYEFLNEEEEEEKIKFSNFRNDMKSLKKRKDQIDEEKEKKKAAKGAVNGVDGQNPEIEIQKVDDNSE